MRTIGVGILALFLAGIATAQAPDPKGRRILTAAEVQKAPYCYFGRIVNQKRPDAIGGVAALVGPRLIVTAAHVIQGAIERQKKYGPVIFVLPGGRQSEVVRAELDKGFLNTRLSCFDFGVCTLKDPLGDGGQHAAWGVFEDADFGKSMTLAGYDFDLAGVTRPPPMVVRSGRVSQQKGGGKIAAVGTALFLNGVYRNRFTEIVGSAGIAVSGLALQQFHSVGWKGDFTGAYGASGGPIWVDRGGVPTVIGVQSGIADVYGDGVSEFCLGSRISPGPAEAMVRDHIPRKP